MLKVEQEITFNFLEKKFYFTSNIVSDIKLVEMRLGTKVNKYSIGQVTNELLNSQDWSRLVTNIQFLFTIPIHCPTDRW